MAQHLVGFFGAYQGRLNSTSNKLLEGWAAGQRFPAAAPDDSQAHAIVKARGRAVHCLRRHGAACRSKRALLSVQC